MWTDTQGDTPTDLWARYLLKIGEKRASEALVGILKSGKTYPPTLPEFIAASKPAPSYYQVFKALPRPKANPKIVKAAITAMRSALYDKDVVAHIPKGAA